MFLGRLQRFCGVFNCLKLTSPTNVYVLVRGVSFKRLIYMYIAGRGTPHMKGGGMLVVSLRGVNFGFWSHSGFSGQNAIILGREGLV